MTRTTTTSGSFSRFKGFWGRHRNLYGGLLRAAARIPVYKGSFGPEQAERLLWRAGFGPRKGEAERLARKGLDAAVHSLTHPREERLAGPKRSEERRVGKECRSRWDWR